ncbi:MAG: efflux RND transporter permease subunit [Pseudobdellovibrionaceae bacterium]|nr:efflux RND transporter permease subunit [Bdellovibrionales bacterium]USN48150.1 MAG: efflux RND transporter permease subunit [Pseudobdellovibrionaceae bacterium]
MKKVFAFFVENHKLSFLMSFLLLAMGILGLPNLRRESRPPVDFAKANIDTFYPGSSPAEVEEKITMKIEDELRSIEGIKDVTSVSQSGLSAIRVRADMDNADTERVMDDVQRAVQRVTDLPKDILDNPKFTKLNAKEIPILEMALIGSNESRQRDRFAEQLESILEDDPGVSSVRLTGYREREFQILLDPIKMQDLHVGITEVEKAVRERTQDIPAGFIRTPGDQKLVRVTGQVKTAEEMGDIVVRSNFSGQRIRIKDVAEVKDGSEDPSVTVRVNGEPATLIIVSKKADADAITVFERLQAHIDDFQKKRLTSGYQIITYNDEPSRIKNRLGIVINNALSGLVLVFIILLLFLPGVLGVMASLSLPLAIFGTLGMMPLMGVNFNNITMLALVIAIGMLVDNSVVISENYARLRLDGLNRRDASLKAVYQFWLPLAATVATTILAFLPMLVTKGIMGQFIRWIPIMVTVALTMSLLEAYFLLPARLKFTIRNLEAYRKKSEGTNSKARTWFDDVRDRFEAFMQKAVYHRYIVLLAVTVLLVSSIVLSIFGNRFELFPREEVEYYYASFETSITSTLDYTDDLAGELSNTIMKTLGPEVVEYIISRAGVQQLGMGGEGKNGDYVGMLVIAVPTDKAKDINPDEVLEKLRNLPKGEFTRLTFDASRRGPPVGEALNVTFRTNNYEQLRGIVDEFKQEISKVDGVVDLLDNEISGGPEYRIIPDHEALAKLNLSTEAVGKALRTALQGAIASELNIAGDEFSLRIRYANEQRATVDSLKSTKIMEPGGRLIPLMSIVNLKLSEAPPVRKHYNFKRSITVTAGVVPEKITSVVLNMKTRKIADSLLEKYDTVSMTYGGEEESTKESTGSLRNAMIIAIFSIFAVLVFLFKTFLHPLLVLTSIPLGLVGVSWAFFLHNKPLSFLALIGVVGLAGVVVNSAIVLVSYINDLIDEGKLGLHEILAKASGNRLRAVLVTSLTTVGGLFPTAYSIGGHDSILVPMTLALAWGLVSGTILTLIWIPCGYAIIDDISGLFHRWFKGLIPVADDEGEALKAAGATDLRGSHYEEKVVP